MEKSKIFGDFFASEPIEVFENKLIGIKHNDEEIAKVLNSIDVTDYFGKVTVGEILEILN
ncbi:lipoate protein ligase C-terminal domain-containing protein [Empedobacter sp.]|uniref:lipoate protein ligase C-terminal domain-containing protein n=1 Tax=Empedobacter sp. TaxID=1927715 RepID=UPI0039181DC2